MGARHWDSVYAAKGDDVSWFEAEPATSLALVGGLDVEPAAAVVDVGGGTSALAARLVSAGHTAVTVVDLSAEALRRQPEGVRTVVADVSAWTPDATYAVWHDRAVFHFLVDEAARDGYRAALRAGTAPGSYAVVATFAPDGPESCSGLPVRRYDAAALAGELGPGWTTVATRRETHVTPWGAEQPFTWVVARRDA